MSYTLRGRVDSRLLAALGPALVAAVLALVLHKWWPVELAALMVGVGLALDIAVYDRVLDYQPGWVALPLGVLELGIVMALAQATNVRAPLAAAIAFFAASWVLAQLLGLALFPWLRLSYADDGGELGRPGASAAAAVAALFLAAGGVAFATRPPTVTLSAGVHRGPLVIDREEILVGKPGAIVRGGIVVRASGVHVKNVTVLGGENGITVESARRVVLDHVRIVGARLDGIHARFSEVHVRDCAISVAGPYAQGIDISYSNYDGMMSSVEGCEVSGGAEGIVTHSSMVMVSGNRVHGTSLRGITMSEMSMGEVSENDVIGSNGVGVYCGDHSECEISRNVVVGTRADRNGDRSRAGIGIVANFYAVARLKDNVLVGNPAPIASFSNSEFERER
jgi:parallel beta helix pectate lyase-like protein